MDKLTERELAVLELLVMGLDNQQIGEKLFLSIHTVKAHVGSIMKKLSASNRTNAAYIAMKNKLI